MDTYLSLGRWFFALPFVVFGVFHFTDAQHFAESIVPYFFPAKLLLVYLTGLTMLVCGTMLLLGKYDKLAALILSLLILVFVVMVYLPNTFNDVTRAAAVPRLVNNLALAGAAMLYAKYVATDKRLLGM
jgi:uncharacterized membrane protein